jgi:hypothetical protein
VGFSPVHLIKRVLMTPKSRYKGSLSGCQPARRGGVRQKESFHPMRVGARGKKVLHVMRLVYNSSLQGFSSCVDS